MIIGLVIIISVTALAMLAVMELDFRHEMRELSDMLDEALKR